MTYAQKIIAKNTIKLYIVPVLALLFIGADLGYIHAQPLDKIITGINGAIIFFLGYISYPLFKKLSDKYDLIEEKIFKQIENAKHGEDGEKEVFIETEHLLGGEKYTLHKNFKLPGINQDIDAIIVGQKGIIIFEIKNYTNQLLFVNDEVFVAVGSKLLRVRPDWDPRREAVRCSYQLKKFFQENGFGRMRVFRAVVFLKKYAARIKKGTKTGVYLVSGIEELGKYIEGLPDDPRFTPEYCEKVNKLLKNNR